MNCRCYTDRPSLPAAVYLVVSCSLNRRRGVLLVIITKTGDFVEILTKKWGGGGGGGVFLTFRGVYARGRGRNYGEFRLS